MHGARYWRARSGRRESRPFAHETDFFAHLVTDAGSPPTVPAGSTFSAKQASLPPSSSAMRHSVCSPLPPSKRRTNLPLRSRNRRRPPRLRHHRPTRNRHPRSPPNLRRSSKHRRNPFPRPPEPFLNLDSLGRRLFHLRGVACEGANASDGEGGVCDVS